MIKQTDLNCEYSSKRSRNQYSKHECSASKDEARNEKAMRSAGMMMVNIFMRSDRGTYSLDGPIAENQTMNRLE